MPLYDMVCLFKAAASRKDVVEIMASVGTRVFARNGVVTGITSFGTQPLGYQIKRQGARFDEGQLMHMTFMAPTAIVDELHVLRQDDRLLRHTVLKHKPFRREEIWDNHALTHLVNNAEANTAPGGVDPYFLRADEDSFPGGDGEHGGDKDYEEDLRLEFAADELNESVNYANASGRDGDGGGGPRVPFDGAGSAEPSEGSSKPVNEALSRWTSIYKERRAQKRRSSNDDDDDW